MSTRHIVQLMPPRPLTPFELGNSQSLQALVGRHELLFPTPNILDKSIFDAVAPLREYLRDVGYHDFASQPVGQAGRVSRAAKLLADDRVVETTVSLYRQAKEGNDPRIWWSGLQEIVQPDDVIAVFVAGQTSYVVNLTQTHLAGSLPSGTPSRALATLREIGGQITQQEPTEIVDTVAALDDLVQRRPLGQRFLTSYEARVAVENHAMLSASSYFEEDGWDVRDVHATESYDLHCTRGAEELRVEVKGTASLGETVFLTKNEVRHAKDQYPQVALYVLASIHLTQDDNGFVTDGGNPLVILPWMLDDAALTPLAYSYQVPT
jgi:hypothetical protein